MRSLVLHLEHFVLQHPETMAVRCSREVSVALLALGYLVFDPVVAIGEKTLGTAVIVATVFQAEVTAISKSRTITAVTINQVVSIIRDVLLLPVEGEQERPLAPVTEITTA